MLLSENPPIGELVAVDIVSPVLSLSTKYKFERLRACAVQRLEEDWPTTLHAWIKHPSEPRDCYDETTDKIRARMAPSIVRLARQHDIPSILPAAYYSIFTQEKPFREFVLCPSMVETFFADRPLDSAFTLPAPYMTFRTWRDEWWRRWDPSHIQVIWPSLSSEDMDVFMQMTHITVKWIERELKQHCTGCKKALKKQKTPADDEVYDLYHRENKRPSFIAPVHNFVRALHSRHHLIELNPIRRTMRYEEFGLYNYDYYLSCPKCKRVMDKDVELANRELWDSFRAIFGLPPLRKVYAV